MHSGVELRMACGRWGGASHDFVLGDGAARGAQLREAAGNFVFACWVMRPIDRGFAALLPRALSGDASRASSPKGGSYECIVAGYANGLRPMGWRVS